MVYAFMNFNLFIHMEKKVKVSWTTIKMVFVTT